MALAALLLLTVSVPPSGLGEGLDAGPRGRLLVRQVDLEDDGGTIRRGAPGLYGMACEIRGDEARDLVPAAAGLADRLGDGIDRSRSVALAGVDNVVLAGSGPAVLVYALRRLPPLSPSAFLDYWMSVHADFGRRALAGQGYRQLHGDAALSADVARAAGVAQHDLDGAVISESTSWEAYRQRRASPDLREAGAAARADEDNFIDHATSVIMRYTAKRACPGAR